MYTILRFLPNSFFTDNFQENVLNISRKPLSKQTRAELCQDKYSQIGCTHFFRKINVQQKGSTSALTNYLSDTHSQHGHTDI